MNFLLNHLEEMESKKQLKTNRASDKELRSKTVPFRLMSFAQEEEEPLLPPADDGEPLAEPSAQAPAQG